MPTRDEFIASNFGSTSLPNATKDQLGAIYDTGNHTDQTVAKDNTKIPAPSVVTSVPAANSIGNAQNAVDNYTLNTNLKQTPTTKDATDTITNDTNNLFNAYDAYNTTVQRINNGTLTPAEQNQVDNLTATFEKTKQLQQYANENYTSGVTTLGIRQGRNRYATEIEEGNVKSSIDQGISKIADIDLKESQAVNELRQSLLDKDFERAQKLYDTYSNFNKQKSDAIFNLVGLAQKDQSLLLDQLQAQQTELTKNYQAAVNGGYVGSLMDFQKEMNATKTNPTELIQNYEYAKANGYNGSFLNFKAAYQQAGQKAAAGPATLSSQDVKRYGLPEDLVGRDEYSIIQDLSVSHVPDWFKGMLQKTEPNKEFSPEGVQSVWETYRSRPDVQVLIHLMDINKAQAGKIQENGGGGSSLFSPDVLNNANL